MKFDVTNRLLGLGLAVLCMTVPALSLAEVDAAASAAAENQAEEALGFSADATAGVFTNYMFRGQNLYNSVSIQPNLNLSYNFGEYGKISGGGWMHIPAAGDIDHEPNFTELDPTISYEVNIGLATLSLGHVWYTYLDNRPRVPTTGEWFQGISLDTFLEPSFTIYEDHQAYEEVYYELTFKEPLGESVFGDCLGKGFNMTPYVTFGWATNAEKYFQRDGLEYITIGTSFEIPFGVLNVVPSLNYTFQGDPTTVDRFWAGVNFNVTF